MKNMRELRVKTISSCIQITLLPLMSTDNPKCSLVNLCYLLQGIALLYTIKLMLKQHLIDSTTSFNDYIPTDLKI